MVCALKIAISYADAGLGGQPLSGVLCASRKEPHSERRSGGWPAGGLWAVLEGATEGVATSEGVIDGIELLPTPIGGGGGGWDVPYGMGGAE